MPSSDGAVLWAVYRVNIEGKSAGVNVVCSQAEWDAMELAHPGRHTLVRSGIASEAEAERLARVPRATPLPRPPAAPETGVAGHDP
jgi:hypothetical protein